eukprot:jgi/Bigna1/68205/fgenesh1_pg.5_\
MQQLNVFLSKHSLKEIGSDQKLTSLLAENLKMVAVNQSGRDLKSSPTGNISNLLRLFREKSICGETSDSTVVQRLIRSLTLLTRAAGYRAQVSNNVAKHMLILRLFQLYSVYFVTKSQMYSYMISMGDKFRLTLHTFQIRREAVNLLRNLCHDKLKVLEVSRLAGIKPILFLLTRNNESPDTRTAAAAALQSISFRRSGRMSIIELGVENEGGGTFEKSQRGYKGFSADAGSKLDSNTGRESFSSSFSILERCMLARVITEPTPEEHERLLKSRNVEEVGYVSGTVQNLARDECSRGILAGGQVVVVVVVMVVVLVAALCALVNILLPQVGTGFEGFKRKRLLKMILSDALALGILGSVLYDKRWNVSNLPSIKSNPSALPPITQAVFVGNQSSNSPDIFSSSPQSPSSAQPVQSQQLPSGSPSSVQHHSQLLSPGRFSSAPAVPPPRSLPHGRRRSSEAPSSSDGYLLKSSSLSSRNLDSTWMGDGDHSCRNPPAPSTSDVEAPVLNEGISDSLLDSKRPRAKINNFFVGQD